MMRQEIEALKSSLNRKLPGKSAQYIMSPTQINGYESTPAKNVRKAAVLVLLYPKNHMWHVCYIKRNSTNKNDKHRGQISFPGGKYELSDMDLAHTALREAQEEIGADPNKITLIGELTLLHVFVSNFLVYPFIGIATEPMDFIKQDSEVNDILEIPLHQLMDHKIIAIKDITVRGISLSKVPYYEILDESLWGASAMITSEFIALLEASEAFKILAKISI